MDPLPFLTLMQSDSTSDACWLAASFQTLCSTSNGPLTLSSRWCCSSFATGKECCPWIDRIRLVLLVPPDAAPTAIDCVGNTTSAAQATSRSHRWLL